MSDEFSSLGKWIASTVGGTGIVALIVRWWVMRISKDLTIVQNDKGERTLYSMMHDQMVEERSLRKIAEQAEDAERRERLEAVRLMDKAIKDHAECRVEVEELNSKVGVLTAEVAELKAAEQRRKEAAAARPKDPATGKPVSRRKDDL